MSSSQLTFIFFRGVGQPPTSFDIIFVYCWWSASDASAAKWWSQVLSGSTVNRSSLKNCQWGSPIRATRWSAADAVNEVDIQFTMIIGLVI
jgi:hypothetical protein